ncbi:MAG TPA: hypothetical protein VHG28_11585 [Longimicrobiaceae bacterium]|nr:hypothetical protein [Longimicrobiaceae bacterium]
MRVPIDKVLTRLHQVGYYVAHVPAEGEDPVQVVLEISRSLGELFVPMDCDPAEPVIRTAPVRSRWAAPFDRPEQIGWHGDFSSYEDRPELSLVYITRPDPRGGNYGAWRLASVARVITALRATDEGRAAFGLLSQERMPFSYADGEEPRWFHIIEPAPDDTFGLRFYLPSIRRGCLGEYGEVPVWVETALNALERAADSVGEVIPTQQGSLLIASNWYALHDRVQQTISRTQPNREALLCFVAHPYVGGFRSLVT